MFKAHCSFGADRYIAQKKSSDKLRAMAASRSLSSSLILFLPEAQPAVRLSAQPQSTRNPQLAPPGPVRSSHMLAALEGADVSCVFMRLAARANDPRDLDPQQPLHPPRSAVTSNSLTSYSESRCSELLIYYKV